MCAHISHKTGIVMPDNGFCITSFVSFGFSQVHPYRAAGFDAHYCTCYQIWTWCAHMVVMVIEALHRALKLFFPWCTLFIWINHSMAHGFQQNLKHSSVEKNLSSFVSLPPAVMYMYMYFALRLIEPLECHHYRFHGPSEKFVIKYQWSLVLGPSPNSAKTRAWQTSPLHRNMGLHQEDCSKRG